MPDHADAFYAKPDGAVRKGCAALDENSKSNFGKFRSFHES
jgi:hypothetical protein